MSTCPYLYVAACKLAAGQVRSTTLFSSCTIYIVPATEPQIGTTL